MIKYNSNAINDWNYDASNIIKVYRNNAVCYYKVSGTPPSPTSQTPCFAVVDDISQYQETEFEDVFNNADGKWYKLNNLNEYEEYGVYGSGRTITTYEGKLTIDEEITPTPSRLPQGYTEVEYIENNSIAFIDTSFKPNQDTRIVAEMQVTTSTSYNPHFGCGAWNKINGIRMGYENGISGTLHVKYGTLTTWTIYSNITGDYNKHTYDFNKNEFYRDNTLIGSVTYGSFQSTDNLGIFYCIEGTFAPTSLYICYGRVYSFKIYDDGTLVRDYVPCINPNNVVGLYDLANGVFYSSPNGYSFIAGSAITSTTATCEFMYSGGSWNNVGEVSGSTYPVYYDVIQDPPNNISFSSMTEAEQYECPWVGMTATIDGDKYIFSGNSTSGYEWIYNPSRLPLGYTEVEYVQNTGTSYFNTNFTPNQDTRILCDMQLVTQTDYPRLWGAGAWDSQTGIMANYEGGYLQMSWLGKTSWTKYTSVPTSTDRRVIDVDKNYLYVDNVQIGSNTYTTKTASNPLGIFTYISGGRPSSSTYWGREHFKGKMFSFKVYDNGTLVRDLVPCIRDNDNEVGAYDIVNDVFYTVPTGYTTDKLVAGNIV